MGNIDSKYQRLLRDYDRHCRQIARASHFDTKESLSDQRRRIERLEASYIDWFEHYFPNYAKVPCAWFHKELAQEVIDNPVCSVLLEVYRSGAKSAHASVGLPLFLYYTGQLNFLMLVSESESKAQRLLYGLQAQFIFNKRLNHDYGSRYNQGDWAKGEFLTTDGKRFLSIGKGQDPRGATEMGNRPDMIVVDDYDRKKHVNNDRIMRESTEFLFEDVMGCFDEAEESKQRFVYANNNFHKNSVTNRLKQHFRAQINKARELGEATKYRILSVPAVKSLSTFEPNWPEKTSAEYWRKKFRDTPTRSFMREYMHTHIEDGAVFRQEDMQWKEMLPLQEYDALCFYGDLSYKTAACHKGMILVGKKDKEFHIIHVFLRQASRTALAKWLYDLYEDHQLEKFPRIRYWIEGLFSMDEFVNDFDSEGRSRGYFIPVRADKRPKADKYDRIEADQSFFERRNVFFNIAERDNADQIELVDQYLAFEKGSGSPVDGPDAVNGALSKLNRVTRTGKAQYRCKARPSRRY